MRVHARLSDDGEVTIDLVQASDEDADRVQRLKRFLQENADVPALLYVDGFQENPPKEDDAEESLG